VSVLSLIAGAIKNYFLHNEVVQLIVISACVVCSLLFLLTLCAVQRVINNSAALIEYFQSRGIFLAFL